MLGSLAAARVILPVRNVQVIAGLDRSGFSSCLWELVTLLSVRLPSLPDPISLPCAGADSLWLHPSPLPFDSREGLSSWSLSLTGSASYLSLHFPEQGAWMLKNRDAAGCQRKMRDAEDS